MSRTPSAAPPKLFVLDTNVLLHDPYSIFQFHDNDVCIPMVVLEELDNNKIGATDIARNGREASRLLDRIVSGKAGIHRHGYPLGPVSNGHGARGRLFIQAEAPDIALPQALRDPKADNQILAIVLHHQKSEPARSVVLVSKDINMRIKARSLGVPAQDYTKDKTLEDAEVLPTGVVSLPEEFWERLNGRVHSWTEGKRTYYTVKSPQCRDWIAGDFLCIEGERPLQAQILEVRGHQATLVTLTDYSSEKNAVFGVTARNRGQLFALNLLMDPDRKFVTLLGQAGTGKTLLTLAAALSQTLELKLYQEVIITRATIPLGEDIGFLPGSEEEKMAPWMGALQDNLEFLAEQLNLSRPNPVEWLASRIKIKSLNYMRGRTFQRKLLIIDEAQNLTPKQMKALITRAGPDTKVICLGNLAQIDTPYLSEGSSGLTYVVSRFRGWPHGGHVTLVRGERSRLADYASDLL